MDPPKVVAGSGAGTTGATVMGPEGTDGANVTGADGNDGADGTRGETINKPPDGDEAAGPKEKKKDHKWITVITSPV